MRASRDTVDDGDFRADGGSPLNERFRDYDYSNFYSGLGDDPFDMLAPFDEWWQWARPAGYYQFGMAMRSAPSPRIDVAGAVDRADLDGLINLASYNYLGLSYRPEVKQATIEAIEKYGLGASGSPILSGNSEVHERFRRHLADFKGTEEALLFPTGYSTNIGVISGLMRPGDLIVADQYAHASIVDGIRLCKAMTDTYKHANMAHLEQKLELHQDKRIRVIITDGVFSMDGDLAPLDEIVALAEKYDALVFVDDSHASGFIGKTGRGTHEKCGIMGKVDIITTTFGKALGGASGGCVSGRSELVEMCRQRARPYLFSNTLPPPLVAAGIKVFEMLSSTTELRDRLEENTRYFRAGMTQAGFDIKEGVHPIVPVMLYDAPLSQEFAAKLLDEGIYVIGFFFPVVPRNEARIRVQVSAAHTREHLDRAIAAFTKVGKELGVID